MRRWSLALTLLLLFALLVSCQKQPEPAVVLSLDELIEEAIRFLTLVSEDKAADAVAMMDKTMARAMPEGVLRGTWDSLLERFGALFEVTLPVYAMESGYHTVRLSCRFAFARVVVKVVLDPSGKVSGLWFSDPEPLVSLYVAPDYADPDLFTETEVQVGADGWVLPGTLTLPKGDGPFPAVVLVHGSGPNDRDESIGPTKPFMDLAWGLASEGVAVLRYEKRTRVYASELAQDLSGLTLWEETVDDAASAVDFLQSRPEIDASRVFVVGHSLGAYAAPRIAQAAPSSPAGLVLLAGNARDILEVTEDQFEYLSSIGKISGEQVPEIENIVEAIARYRQGLLGEGEELLGASKAYWDDLQDYDPAGLAASFDIPILVLWGERDYQVTIDDFRIWQDTLSGRSGVVCRSLPGLNHLFIPGEGQPSPDEYGVPGNVDIEVVRSIAEWIGR